MAKNKNSLMYNKMLAMQNAKEHFLSLCAQYERMGQLLAMQGKALTHPQFAKTSVNTTQKSILQQFHEMGEEMKNIGASLDLCGGNPVMKKEEPEKEENPKKKTTKKKFVSNIKPKKKNHNYSPGESGDVGFGPDFDTRAGDLDLGFDEKIK